MTEDEWDAVIKVHLKGHFAPTRWAAAYWREQHKAGVTKSRNVVHTSSTSGLFSNPGQSNYGAAKLGLAGLTKALAAVDVDLERIAAGDRDSARRRAVDLHDYTPNALALLLLGATIRAFTRKASEAGYPRLIHDASSESVPPRSEPRASAPIRLSPLPRRGR